MLGLTRRTGGHVVALLAVCSLNSVCVAAPPGDAIGSWKLTCVCPDGKSRDCVIKISKEGQALRATYRADGVTRAARTVAFNRGVLSVEVDGHFAGSKYGLTYKGRPEGNTFCGDVLWKYSWASGKFAFKGERVEESAVVAR